MQYIAPPHLGVLHCKLSALGETERERRERGEERRKRERGGGGRDRERGGGGGEREGERGGGGGEREGERERLKQHCRGEIVRYVL